MDAMRDLSAVTRQSQSIELKVRGTLLRVNEVTMQKLADFIRACAPFLSAMDQLAEVKETREELGEPLPNASRKVEDKYGLFRLIGDHTLSFLEAASLVCTVDGHLGEVGARAFLERLRPDEFFHIALAIVEVNGDFFILRLTPALKAFFVGVSQIGLSRSTDLSPLDTTDLSSIDTSTESSGDTLRH